MGHEICQSGKASSSQLPTENSNWMTFKTPMKLSGKLSTKICPETNIGDVCPFSTFSMIVGFGLIDMDQSDVSIVNQEPIPRQSHEPRKKPRIRILRIPTYTNCATSTPCAFWVPRGNLQQSTNGGPERPFRAKRVPQADSGDQGNKHLLKIHGIAYSTLPCSCFTTRKPNGVQNNRTSSSHFEG